MKFNAVMKLVTSNVVATVQKDSLCTNRGIESLWPLVFCFIYCALMGPSPRSHQPLLCRVLTYGRLVPSLLLRWGSWGFLPG